MGLLDDAIREHLELKRRRGADTEEIARQEHEAFGPARRGDLEPVAAPEADHPVEPALDAPAEFAAAHDEAPTVLHAVEDPDHLVEEVEPPRPHGDPADHLPHTAHHEHPHVHDHELAEAPRPHGDPADHLPHVEPQPVQEHRVVEPPGQPTREFDPDEVRAAAGEEPAHEEPGEEDGDVLEETPEFLQETPEHDRLWFEQRPPRDFDF